MTQQAPTTFIITFARADTLTPQSIKPINSSSAKCQDLTRHRAKRCNVCHTCYDLQRNARCKICGHETKRLTFFLSSPLATIETMTSTTMRQHSRLAVPLPAAAAVIIIIGLLAAGADAFSFIANGGRGSFLSPAMTSRSTSSSTAASPLFMTFTMPVMPKLDFNAPSAVNNGAIWYESCVDPKARLPEYDEE